LRAYERTGAEGQIAGSDGQREMSPTDDARAVAPVTWDEIGNGSRNAGTPRSRPFSADQSTAADAFGCRFKWLPPGKLRPHPILQRYGIAPRTAEHNKIVQQDDAALQQAIDVTTDGIILDGYPQWKAALDSGRSLVLCIEHALNEQQQIEWLLRRNKGRKGWNAFCRIMTALALELKLRGEARHNQFAGGQKKVLSNLTKAQKRRVRAKLAELAHTCEAYIDYVKQLVDEADEKILQALERGEISIHWAWTLLKFSKSEQREILEHRGNDKAVQAAYPRPRKQKSVSIDRSRMRQIWRVLDARDAGEIKCSVVSIDDDSVEIRVQMKRDLFTKAQAQGELELP